MMVPGLGPVLPLVLALIWAIAAGLCPSCAAAAQQGIYG